MALQRMLTLVDFNHVHTWLHSHAGSQGITYEMGHEDYELINGLAQVFPMQFLETGHFDGNPNDPPVYCNNIGKSTSWRN